MQNDKTDPLSLSFASKDAAVLENKLLVAATVAAVLVAGSAIAYRQAAVNSDVLRRLFRHDPQILEKKLGNEKIVEGTVHPDAMVPLPTASTSTTTYTGQELEYDPAHTTGTNKSSRSKDRRKRGKDPLKEALKSGKKLKTPPGSSSTPSSPKPSAALLSPSSIGRGKQVGENLDLYLAFEAGSSLADLRTHTVDSSQALSESQRNPTKRRQRESSPSRFDAPTMHLSATGHYRDTSDVSQPSRFTHEGEDGLASADFPGESNYRLHAHLQSQDSLTQSSLSHPRSPSSLADFSEAEPEDGGWTTSASKSRPRQRARLADVVFGDVRTGHDGGENKTEVGLAMGKGKARALADKSGDTESHSKSVLVEVGKIPQSNVAPIAFPSTLHASRSDLNTNTEELNHPSNPTSKISRLPSALIDPSSEKHDPKIRKQECSRDTDDGAQRNSVATPSQTSSSGNHGTRGVNGTEVWNGEEAQEKLDDRKQPKGNNGKSYASFSSAVTGVKGTDGRVGIGQAASNKSTSRRGLTETDDISGLNGHEEVETEFIFPTLNSHASTSSIGPSPSARSPLVGASVSSQSPSKKNKKFSTSKSGTPPPNPPAPSNTRESHTAGSNAGGAGTGMPALSAQTQLASLRGALEAARLREEKHKVEMEKAMKEMETLKWESANGRREVVELQTQVRQLTHQLHSYAAMFASVTPHLNSHLAMQLPLMQLYPQIDAGRMNPPDPGSSPKIDPGGELPNGDVPSTSKAELEPRAAQDAAVTSSDNAQEQDHVPITPPSPQTQPLQTPSSPVSEISSPAQHPIPPAPSTAIPAFFPYTIPPYSPTQHPHFPVHPPPWMYHPHYPSSQNSSGANSGPSSVPSPLQHYANVYSPLMYPISPVTSPVSPESVGMMSHQFLHQHQPFGFGGGWRSTGTSSAGSHSPEITGSSTGFSKQKSRMRRRKSQMANLNGHSRIGCEDVGDGWIGLGRMQTTASNVDKGRRIFDEGAIADGEGDDVDVESTSSPYSELLADAILKRSSTIRPSKKNDKKENGPLDRKEGAEEIEPFTEFTFPSLSDFGSGYYRTASRTESSISSSLSSSPPSTTATVPDYVGDQDDKASLPPVIENADDSGLSAVVQDIRLNGALSKIQDALANEQAIPKREVHEQSTDSRLE